MGIECVFVRYILYSNSPAYVILTYINSTSCEFLQAGANLKESWKCILHPVGNKEQETFKYIILYYIILYYIILYYIILYYIILYSLWN